MLNDHKRNRFSGLHSLRANTGARLAHKGGCHFKGDDEFVEGMDAFELGDFEKAVGHWKISSRLGNSEAQYALSWCFAHGAGVPEDALEALKWCRKSAEQGLSIGQLTFAHYYDAGECVRQNMSKAGKWYRKAAVSLLREAEQDNADAQFLLASLLRYGKGMERDLNEASKWYRKAAALGNDDAQLELGHLYLHGICVKRNAEKAFEWFRESAMQGNDDAALILGKLYHRGNGTPKSLEKAFRWFLRSARHGNAEAAHYLAMCYEHGEGVETDKVKAVTWLGRSALIGNPDDAYKLGVYYANGSVVCRDMDKAVFFWKIAAKQDNREAWFRLGQYYWSSNEEPDHKRTALRCFWAAAESGHVEAQYCFGLCLEQGTEDILPNKAAAAFWFQEAANRMHPGAHYSLSRLHEKGEGVPRDLRKAHALLCEAARLGFAEAQFSLGLRYYNGIGLRESKAEGILWLIKAAEQLHGKAWNTLSEYIDTGSTEVRKAIEKHARCGSVVAQDIIRRHEEECMIRQAELDLLNEEHPETISPRTNPGEEPTRQQAHMLNAKKRTTAFAALRRVVTKFFCFFLRRNRKTGGKMSYKW